MRKRRVSGTRWVRACLLIPAALAAIVGFFVVSGALVESDQPTVGDVVGYVDFATLLAVLLLGPAWVLRGFRRPSPPRDDGPPGGRVVPLATRVPECSGESGVERVDEAA